MPSQGREQAVGWVMGTTVNDGVEHALDQAREPAAERDVRA
ncbi:hypothetical protein ABT121_35700 [Streptomyces sp. NPDC001928]